uniref:Putative calmodulin-4 n=1 Tax=Davidia involucrata TaxID=16924 RepID=A0A5B6YUG4_DAVIN
MCPTGSALRPETTKRPDLRSAFDVIDADHDGKISRDDLRKFYSGFYGATASDEDVIGSMISAADSNKDGFVEYDEFEKVLISRERINGGRGGGWGVMEEVFKVMDRDGDGKLSHDDLKSFLTLAGFNSSDDDIKAMIRLSGGDEVDAVTYDGLLKILAVG